jgi:hypothetical protein
MDSTSYFPNGIHSFDDEIFDGQTYSDCGYHGLDPFDSPYDSNFYCGELELEEVDTVLLLPSRSGQLNSHSYFSSDGQQSAINSPFPSQGCETTVFDLPGVPVFGGFCGVPYIPELSPFSTAQSSCAPSLSAVDEYSQSIPKVDTAYQATTALELGEKKITEQDAAHAGSPLPGRTRPPEALDVVPESKHPKEKSSLSKFNMRAPKKSRGPPKSLLSVFHSNTESQTRRRSRKAFTEEGKKKVEAVRIIGACVQCRARKRTVCMLILLSLLRICK